MINRKTYRIDGMHCSSCALLIEGELEDIGVNAKVSYPKQTVSVTFDPKKTSSQDIRQAVARAGYSLSETDKLR